MAQDMAKGLRFSMPQTFTEVDVTAEALGPTNAHIVTCHLAVHYWCDSEAHLTGFFAQAMQATRASPDALLVLSFADGRWVVRMGRDALSLGRRCDDVVSIDSGPISIRIKCKHLALRSCTGPFGADYQYQLAGRLQSCTEYLVHEGALQDTAAKAGWTMCCLSERMDVLCGRLGKGAHFSRLASLMKVRADVEHPTAEAALYRVMVFAKTKRAAVAFHEAVWSRPAL
jgi:hypothetical protein